MTTKKILSVTEAVKIAEAARQEWTEKYISEDSIRKTVHERLDRIMEKAIFAFLGLEYDFGRIRIDTTNSRKSVLFQQVERLAQQSLPDITAKYISKVQDRMGKDEINALREEYKRCLKNYLRNALQEKAAKDAEIILQNLTKNEALLEQQLDDNRVGLEELANDECGTP